MTMATEFCNVWLEHDGRIVTFDGLKCVVRVSSYMQKYPYERNVTDVSLEPTVAAKRSKRYGAIKMVLGDDWSTDVLSAEPELQTEILQQLGVE